jgi:transposase
MTEYGYKYKKLGSEQINLLTAYDVTKNCPVAMKMFDGSKNDKASVKELIKDVLKEGCLYLMDRGFYSPELKKMIAAMKATYIMPLSSNMDAYQEALKHRRGRMKTFIYKRREGIHIIKSVVSGRRIPYEIRPPQIPACSFTALGSLQG